MTISLVTTTIVIVVVTVSLASIIVQNLLFLGKLFLAGKDLHTDIY